jgi:hypothetical protein
MISESLWMSRWLLVSAPLASDFSQQHLPSLTHLRTWQRNKTLILQRTFAELDQHCSEGVAKNFIDCVDGKLDTQAHLFLSEQLEMAPSHVRRYVATSENVVCKICK